MEKKGRQWVMAPFMQFTFHEIMEKPSCIQARDIISTNQRWYHGDRLNEFLYKLFAVQC
jgi:hypothetical protein